MHRHLLLLCWLALLPALGWAQYETAHWYWGTDSARIRFIPGVGPTVPPQPGVFGWGGPWYTSMSDPCGNLLFYTHNNEVRNANHQLMGSLQINGILQIFGKQLFSISAPGNPNQYFLFAKWQNPQMLGTATLGFWTIDMSLNGGLGGILPNTTTLLDSASVHSAGTLHANGRDYWVVGRKHGTNLFFAFLITPTGILPPVVSTAGPVVNGVFYQTELNEMIFSPDGEKIALKTYVYNGASTTYVMDFNPSSGIVSNPIELAHLPQGTYPPGHQWLDDNRILFSPNGSKLYRLKWELGNILLPTTVYQTDLSSGNPTTIASSVIPAAVDTGSTIGLVDMMYGPDGRIYILKDFIGPNYQYPNDTLNHWMGIIQNPDELGIACNYQAQGFDYITEPSVWGGYYYLPYFSAHYFRPLELGLKDSSLNAGGLTVCLPDTAKFRVSGYRVDSVRWDFGESGVAPITFVGDSAEYLYAGPGTYPVQAVVYRGCPTYPDTLYDTILVRQSPIVDLGPDTALCQGQSLDLSQTTLPNTTYLWQDNSASASYQATTDGLYWLEASNSCGTFRDSVGVDFHQPGTVSLGADTLLCTGDSLLLNLSLDQGSYLWDDASSDSTRMIYGPGTYFVAAENACGLQRDTLAVGGLEPPLLDFGADSQLCQGEVLILRAAWPEASYLWSDGSDADSLVITQPGLYWAEVQNTCGIIRDSIEVDFLAPPSVSLGADTLLCEGEAFTLGQDLPTSYDYLWSTGDTSRVQTFTEADCYSVEASNICGVDRDTLCLSYETPPQLSLGADTTLCENGTLLLDASWPNATYRWQDGSSGSDFTVTQAGTYHVRVSLQACEARDTVQIDYRPLPRVDLGGDQLVCDQPEYTLTASFAPASYRWNDGSTEQSLTATATGLYAVQVSNSCGEASDSVSLTFEQSPEVSLGLDTLLCEGEILLLDATWPRADYLWQDGSVEPVLVVNEAGSYSVQLTTDCGEAEDQLRVDYEDAPAINLPPDTLICEGQFLLIDLQGRGDTYRWQDGSAEPRRELAEPGRYWVEVGNRCGTSRDSLQLDTEPCDCHIFVPTVFTPNQDGINETFAPGYSCRLIDYELRVFDRWGRLQFLAEQPDQGWDGFTPQGAPCPEGVYTWTLRYRYYDATAERVMHRGGTVQVVR